MRGLSQFCIHAAFIASITAINTQSMAKDLSNNLWDSPEAAYGAITPDLNLEYFDGINFNTRVFFGKEGWLYKHWDANQLPWGTHSKAFSLRWWGNLTPPVTDDYTIISLIVGGISGVRVWINNQLIIDDWKPHPGTNITQGIGKAAKIHLEGGKPYAIKIESFSQESVAHIELQWFYKKGLSTTPEIIPFRYLSAPQPTVKNMGTAPACDIPVGIPGPRHFTISELTKAIPTITVPDQVRSIQKAVDIAKPGDVIMIRSSATPYFENVVIRNSGNKDNLIRIIAEEQGKVTIVGRVIADSRFNPQFIKIRGIRVVGTPWPALIPSPNCKPQELTVDGSPGRCQSQWDSQLGGIETGSNWTVEDVISENSMGYGMRVTGDRVTVRHSLFRNNRRLGIGGVATNLWVESVETANNNLGKFDASFEGGGAKFVNSQNVTILNMDTHDNFGPGLWLDWKASNYKITCSKIHDNKGVVFAYMGVGLALEISEGPGLVERNMIYNNRGAGLGLWESMNITIRDNKLVNNALEFRGMQTRGSYRLENIDIYRNDFINAIVSDSYAISPSQYLSRNILFHDNHGR